MSDVYYEFPVYVANAAHNGYLVHQAAYRLMLEPGKDCVRNFIFDLEGASDGTGLYALIRSKRIPTGATGIKVSPPEPGRYRFHLRAVTRKKNNINASTCAERQIWLKQRARVNGFELIGLPKLRTRTRNFSHHGRCFRIVETVFSGLIEVVDPGRFHRVWRDGIGDQKGFGYGLISLYPAA